jgi:hypothetical protein
VKGGLRLDRPELATQPAKSGRTAIVPGAPDQSELIRRLTTTDEEDRMPPPKARHQITPAQVDLLKQWVQQGAKYQSHWAYVPPGRVAVPPVGDSKWAQNEIDAFILAKLNEQGLKPSPPAERVTLLRRLYFDLTGLPPTPAEVDSFVADESTNAVERVVDRLLASQHFGERLAVHWLDLVRYADTRGYHGDQHQDVNRYREYVIDAFNRNKPFGEFTREQIAGDLLPGAIPEARVASAYNRLLMTTAEIGVQELEYRAKYAADRVRNLSSVWLASTIGCAECHDHKHDPFTQRDFYRLAAFFEDIKELAVGDLKPVRVASKAMTDKVRELTEEMEPLAKRLANPTEALATAQVKWEKAVTSWTGLEPDKLKAVSGGKLEVLEDAQIRASGDNPETNSYVITVTTSLQGISGFMLELLPDMELTTYGPGRSISGHFVLNEFELTANGQPVKWAAARASSSMPGWHVAGAVDGKLASGWSARGRLGSVNCAVFEPVEKVGAGSATKLVFTLKQTAGGQQTIGRFRLLAATGEPPFEAVTMRALPLIIARILKIDPKLRIPDFKKKVSDYYRTVAPDLEEARSRFTALRKEMDALTRSEPLILVSESGERRETRILKRGDWMDRAGEVVQPGLPAVLASEGNGAAGRMELAKWLGAPDNPLVARVFVNRLWALLFGEGIVATADDFGAQGAAPTHPELLDWLAIQFADSKGDIKAMVRLMVLSATYQQSSRESEALKATDPKNQWLSRQRRFRLEAEMIRDNALAMSGMLNDRPGPNSLKAYQPAGYWAQMNFPPREYEDDPVPAQYRRSVYNYWCRTFPHPSLVAFDAPPRMECVAQRPRSNTPQQALVLMNDPIYVEAARAFAQRIMAEGGAEAASRLRLAYRLALARLPTAAEEALMLDLLARHLKQYEAEPAAAGKLLDVGNYPLAKHAGQVELAAWISVARVLLNLHETITRN